MADNSKTVVLVADDEPDMLRFLKSQLSTHYQVLEAVDGQQAIEKAAQFLPDVILLDGSTGSLSEFDQALVSHVLWQELSAVKAGHVVELNGVADAGLALRQLALEGEHGRLLAEAHDARGGEHRDVAGAECDGGVTVVDGERHVGGQPRLDRHGG